MKPSQLYLLEKKNIRKQMLSQPGLLIVTTSLIFLFCLFAFYPLMAIIVRTVWNKGWDFSVLKNTVSSKYYWHSFFNSILLGAIVSVIATLVGFVFAFAVTRTELPGKRIFHLIAMLPIVSPPFVIALALIVLFGRSGLITKGLLGIVRANVYGMHSLIFVQVLGMFPLAYLNMKGILESINTSVEDAAQCLGANRGRVFRTVTLPLCIPAVFSSILLVFIKSVSDFGNPQLLGGDFVTLSSQAYLQINGMHNTRAGALIAISILIPSMVAFAIQKYWVSRKSYVSVTGKPTRGGKLINERYIVIPLLIICALLALVVILFYGTVVWISFVKTLGVDMTLTLENFRFAFSRGGDYIKDSFLLSLVATPISAFTGMLISYLIVRKDFIGKRIIEFGSMLVFAVPGIVLGISYILAFNKRPFMFTGTAFIIIISMVFRHMSIGVEAGSNSIRQVDASIEEASINLGAGAGVTFWKISLPLMKSALYVSLVNAFVRSMTSISAVIFLVSVNYNLLTVLIMSEVESGRYGTAAAYCVILMIIVFVAFAVMDIAVNKIGGKRRNIHE